MQLLPCIGACQWSQSKRFRNRREKASDLIDNTPISSLALCFDEVIRVLGFHFFNIPSCRSRCYPQVFPGIESRPSQLLFEDKQGTIGCRQFCCKGSWRRRVNWEANFQDTISLLILWFVALQTQSRTSFQTETLPLGYVYQWPQPSQFRNVWYTTFWRWSLNSASTNNPWWACRAYLLWENHSERVSRVIMLGLLDLLSLFLLGLAEASIQAGFAEEYSRLRATAIQVIIYHGSLRVICNSETAQGRWFQVPKYLGCSRKCHLIAAQALNTRHLLQLTNFWWTTVRFHWWVPDHLVLRHSQGLGIRVLLALCYVDTQVPSRHQAGTLGGLQGYFRWDRLRCLAHSIQKWLRSSGCHSIESFRRLEVYLDDGCLRGAWTTCMRHVLNLHLLAALVLWREIDPKALRPTLMFHEHFLPNI